eukprot:286874_1
MNIANKLLNDSKLQFCVKYCDLKSNPYQIITNIYDKLSWEYIKNDQTVLDKILSKDSHKGQGGLQSHRKGQNKYAFLKQYHLNEINNVIQHFKEYDEMTPAYTLPKTVMI